MKWGKLLIPAVALVAIIKLSAAAPTPAKSARAPQEARAPPKPKDEAMRRYYREMATGIGSNAIQAPFGRFLLIKSGPQCLALRLTEHVELLEARGVRGYSSKYEWFLQPDGSMDFSKPNVEKGKIEMSERKSGNSPSGSPTLKAGSFPLLEWSSGDWVYFTRGATPVGGHSKGSALYKREKALLMARTEWVRIGDVKLRGRRLNWLSKDSATFIAEAG